MIQVIHTYHELNANNFSEVVPYLISLGAVATVANATRISSPPGTMGDD